MALPQAYAFIAIAWAWGVRPALAGLVAALPALLLGSLMLGGLGLLLPSAIRQLENFAGVMNFVIFPMFFASTALHPLWHLREASPVLGTVAPVNPFTHVVELIRFALYERLSFHALLWVAAALAGFLTAALWSYRPSRARGFAGGG